MLDINTIQDIYIYIHAALVTLFEIAIPHATQVEVEENFTFLISFLATFADQMPTHAELKD